MAYLSFEYAEWKEGGELQAREAYKLINEYGFEEKILNETTQFAELSEYKVPTTMKVWQEYISKARTVLGKNKYTRRSKIQESRSAVKWDEIESQDMDD